MAEEVGFLEHYQTAYRLGSDLIHAGLAIGQSHGLDWSLEALVTGHQVYVAGREFTSQSFQISSQQSSKRKL